MPWIALPWFLIPTPIPPNNLAREANVITGELSFAGIRKALQKKDLTTIEFFPEEGKYHLDGHRNCKVLGARGNFSLRRALSSLQ